MSRKSARPVPTADQLRDMMVEGGREGARRRWGPPRHLNTGNLPAPVREGLAQLVDALNESHDREAR